MRKLTVEDLNRMDIDTFKQSDKTPLVMVLDNIRSLHNVGSVLRTADAFRLEGVWMCGITATPPSAEIHKTALGAEDSVNWTYTEDTLDAVKNYNLKATLCWPSNRLKAAKNSVSSASTLRVVTPWSWATR